MDKVWACVGKVCYPEVVVVCGDTCRGLGDGIATQTTAGPPDSLPGRLTEVGAGPTAVSAEGLLYVDSGQSV